MYMYIDVCDMYINIHIHIYIYIYTYHASISTHTVTYTTKFQPHSCQTEAFFLKPKISRSACSRIKIVCLSTNSPKPVEGRPAVLLGSAAWSHGTTGSSLASSSGLLAASTLKVPKQTNSLHCSLMTSYLEPHVCKWPSSGPTYHVVDYATKCHNLRAQAPMQDVVIRELRSQRMEQPHFRGRRLEERLHTWC